MEIRLKRAGIDDAEMIWQMQLESFRERLERYRDNDTRPVAESCDHVRERLGPSYSYYYLILADDEPVGAIRVVDHRMPEIRKRISSLFVLPQYRGKGIASRAIQEVERIHGKRWKVVTIMQEKEVCRFYEKMGYTAARRTRRINDNMTLIFYQKD